MLLKYIVLDNNIHNIALIDLLGLSQQLNRGIEINMHKLGRNEKCPCGSSKKYKKCCLHKDEAIKDKKNENIKLAFDITSILHARCIHEDLLKECDIKIDYKKLFIDYCNDNLEENNFIGSKDIGYLDSYIEYVEELIINLCSMHTSYEMFFWYRRIRPTNIFNVKDMSLFSYHELMKLSMLTFGTKNDIFNKEINNLAAKPNYLEGIDESNILKVNIPKKVINALTSIYKLEYLSNYYIYLRICNRIFVLSDGVFEEDTFYGVKIGKVSKNKRYLMDLYDSRVKETSLLSNIGTFSSDYLHSDQGFTLLSLQHNFYGEKLDYLQELNFIDEDSSTNFRLAVINIEQYYNLTKTLNPVLYQKLGFNIEDILAIIFYYSYSLALKVHVLTKDDYSKTEFMTAFSILQRGYLLTEDTDSNRRQLVTNFMEMYQQKFPNSPKPVVKNILNAYKYLFLGFGNFDLLEFELLKGSLFSKITKSKILVDCTAFASVLRGIITAFRSIDGDFGNVISTDFEEKVNSEVKTIFGIDSIYRAGEITNSLGNMKELDSSFIYKNFLFIIECKSLSVSDESILGEKGAVDFRTKKIKQYFKEVESKAKFIQENSSDLSIKLPTRVKFIVPILVTSFHEYIWETTDEMFIAKGVPRILVPSELKRIESLSSDSIRQLRNRPYVVRLN